MLGDDDDKTPVSGSVLTNPSGEWVIDASLVLSSTFLSVPTTQKFFAYDTVIEVDQVTRVMTIDTVKARIVIQPDGSINVTTKDYDANG